MRRIIEWWHGLSQRERGLVGILGLLLTGLVFWYAIIVPLTRAQDAAAHRRLIAEQRLERLDSAIAARQTTSGPQNMRAALEQAARQATVQPQLGMAEDGYLSFALERTAHSASMQWLLLLSEQGVEVTALRIEPHDDGTVTMRGAVQQ